MIERLLRKQIIESKTILECFYTKKASLDIDIAKEQRLLEEVYMEIQKYCKHENTEINSVYEPGGYDYKSQTTRTLHCNDCGKVLDTKVTIGSFQ